MLKNLTQALDVQKFAVSEFVVAAGQTEDVFTVPVALDETVQVLFAYTIHDRKTRSAKVGQFQVLASGHTTIPDPVPSAHVTTEAYGEEPTLMNIDVRSTGPNVIFRGVNTLTQQEPMFVSAQIQVLHIPAIPPPRLRLTITGMTGGQNFNGLGNGVHILTPISYYRSPLSGSATSVIVYTTGPTTTLTFATSTACELWNMAPPAGPFSSYQGAIKMGKEIAATSSKGAVVWHDGSTTQNSSNTFTTGVTGFAQDRILSGSWVVSGVTFTWEREPTDLPVRWGNY